MRSALAAVKDGAGAISVETVLEEIAKLQQLRALGLPEGLFRDVPATLLTPYRQRAASEPPRELRRHPPAMRYMLLAAFCWQRQQEITDTLVELLIHIAHRVGVRAEEKVDGALMKYAKQVIGKAKLLYKLAKAAKGQPDGVVRDVIYSAVDEQTLDHVIHEAEAAATYEHQVKWVTRASYNTFSILGPLWNVTTVSHAPRPNTRPGAGSLTPGRHEGLPMPDEHIGTSEEQRSSCQSELPDPAAVVSNRNCIGL